MNTKILITDSYDKSLLAPQYIKYFKSLGFEIVSFYQSEYWKPKNLMDKILFRFYPNIYFQKANQILKELVIAEKPDIVLIFKGMEIYPETLRVIKKLTKLLINYNPDHPFEFISRASGNKNVLTSIPLFDVHITYSHYIRQQLISRFDNINVEVLPFGFDSSFNQIKSIGVNCEIIKVCFIGYCDKDRAYAIRKLLSDNIEVDVYGSKWNNYFADLPENLTIYNSVTGIQYYEILSKYRVQLNLLRKHNKDSHNMRSFEIPGCGGIMVTPFTTEHEFFFANGKEAFLYKSFNELLSIIKHLLKLSNSDAQIIRDNARLRCYNSGYTYKDRTDQLIQIINKYNETRRDVYSNF